MEARSYKLSRELPLQVENKKNIHKSTGKCQSCGAKLIFQHMPNYKDYILKEVSRCSRCEIKPIHQFHWIH